MESFGYAYFVERPRRLEDLMVPHPLEKERPYRIVTELRLPAIDYENFITDMLADRQFLSDHGSRCKKGEVWDCLLVRRRGQPDGVLVMPEGECFVGWAAYYAEMQQHFRSPRTCFFRLIGAARLSVKVNAGWS